MVARMIEHANRGTEAEKSNITVDAQPNIEVVFAPPNAERDAKIMRRVYARILGRNPPSA